MKAGATSETGAKPCQSAYLRERGDRNARSSKVIAFVGGAAVWQCSPPSGVLHLAISFDVA
jgi:hypothetical protein